MKWRRVITSKVTYSKITTQRSQRSHYDNDFSTTCVNGSFTPLYSYLDFKTSFTYFINQGFVKSPLGVSYEYKYNFIFRVHSLYQMNTLNSLNRNCLLTIGKKLVVHYRLKISCKYFEMNKQNTYTVKMSVVK